MPGIGDRRNKLYTLDTELCCALYIRLGSFDKVGARLETEGFRHPTTNQPFSRGGISSAIKRSKMYAEYFERRAADPTLPNTPTPEEYEMCLKVIEERMPLQKRLMQDAEDRQAIRAELAGEFVHQYASQKQK